MTNLMKCKKFLMVVVISLMALLAGMPALTASANIHQITPENATKAQLENHLRKPIDGTSHRKRSRTLI